MLPPQPQFSLPTPQNCTRQGSLRPFLSAEISHRADTVEIEVFNPFRHFFYCATTYVAADIRLSAEQAAEFEKFVSTETIVFSHAAPVGVYHLGTLFARTNAIAPVVFIGKTSPGQRRLGILIFFSASTISILIRPFFGTFSDSSTQKPS